MPDGFVTVGPLAYRGKPDCDNVTCTRLIGTDGKWSKDCMGWHCAYCDAPCSSQGHRCDASDAVLGEARRQIAARKAAYETDSDE
jgi:hypothetical protein